MALEDLVAQYQNLPTWAQVGIPIGGVAAIGFIALHKSSGAPQMDAVYGAVDAGSSQGGTAPIAPTPPPVTGPGGGQPTPPPPVVTPPVVVPPTPPPVTPPPVHGGHGGGQHPPNPAEPPGGWTQTYDQSLFAQGYAYGGLQPHGWNGAAKAFTYAGPGPGTHTPSQIGPFQTRIDISQADPTNPADLAYIANNYYRGNTAQALRGITEVHQEDTLTATPGAVAAARAKLPAGYSDNVYNLNQVAQGNMGGLQPDPTAAAAAANAALYGNPTDPGFTGRQLQSTPGPTVR